MVKNIGSRSQNAYALRLLKIVGSVCRAVPSVPTRERTELSRLFQTLEALHEEGGHQGQESMLLLHQVESILKRVKHHPSY